MYFCDFVVISLLLAMWLVQKCQMTCALYCLCHFIYLFLDSSSEMMAIPLDTRFFMLVKIIFDVICPKMREMFVSLWDKQKREYGPWATAAGSKKLFGDIRCNRKFKCLRRKTRKRIAREKLDKFDPTCLFNVILHLHLFQLEKDERKSVEKFEEIRNNVLHSISTNMPEYEFKKFKDEIYNAFRGLRWDTGCVKQLIETQQCISLQDYERLKKIYEHEKQQFFLELKHMDQRASGLEKTMQNIKGEVLQLKHKFEDRESREVTQEGNATGLNERVSSLERSVHEMQEMLMQQQALVIEVLKDKQLQRREQDVFVSEVLKDIQSQRKEQNIFVTEVLKDMQLQRKEQSAIVTAVLKDMQLQHEEQNVFMTEALKEMKSQAQETQSRLLGLEYQLMENHTMVKSTLTEMQNKQNVLTDLLHKELPKPREPINTFSLDSNRLGGIRAMLQAFRQSERLDHPPRDTSNGRNNNG